MGENNTRDTIYTIRDTIYNTRGIIYNTRGTACTAGRRMKDIRQ